MKKQLVLSALGLILSFSAMSSSAESKYNLSWYQETYSFYTIPDTFFTVESEFEIPKGYHRSDSSALSDYQYWISYFPLWGKGKSVGKYQGQRLYHPSQISRVLHLPWQSRFFTDRAIPIRLLGEYLVYKQKENELKIVPKAGDLLTYENWLNGKPVYNSLREVILQPTGKRDPGPEEYYPYLLTCMKNTSYLSLIKNCDSISVKELAPGDLYIGHTADDRKGFVFVIMNRVDNDSGDHLFTVGKGENQPCDFHIPLIGDDRTKPWLTVDEIKQLAPETEFTGFFRLKIK